jgi:hypothetical protein
MFSMLLLKPKELAKQAREEQRRSKMKETSPEFTTFEPLIQEAVDYCRSIVKPKPNAPNSLPFLQRSFGGRFPPNWLLLV